MAGNYLEGHDGSYAFNLGNGNGFSVLEVIHAAEKVVGSAIPYDVVAPRSGDPAILVADAALASEELAWRPTYTNIEEIIATAWQWHQNEKF